MRAVKLFGIMLVLFFFSFAKPTFATMCIPPVEEFAFFIIRNILALLPLGYIIGFRYARNAYAAGSIGFLHVLRLLMLSLVMVLFLSVIVVPLFYLFSYFFMDYGLLLAILLVVIFSLRQIVKFIGEYKSNILFRKTVFVSAAAYSLIFLHHIYDIFLVKMIQPENRVFIDELSACGYTVDYTSFEIWGGYIIGCALILLYFWQRDKKIPSAQHV